MPSFMHVLSGAAKTSPTTSAMEEDSEGSSISSFLRMFAQQGELALEYLRRVLRATAEKRQV